MAEGEATNVKVMVRVRPFNSRELALSKKAGKRLNCAVRMRGTTCAVLEYSVDDKGFTIEKEREAFSFDCCFWSIPVDQEVEPSINPFATQSDVYRESGKMALDAAFEGFNTCIFAYGQTGSGKTHTMLGNDADPGVSPRLVDDLFERIAQRSRSIPTTKCKVEVMFFEIYNEKVRDLFADRKKQADYEPPRIRNDKVKGVFVEGLKRHAVDDANTTKSFMEHGVAERAMAPTKMNQTSSRSHAVFQLQLTQLDGLKGTQKISTINLVDLAGSERNKMSEVTGDSFTEAKNINQSLSTLRRVIDTLIENSMSKRQKPPPFRESVLTYLLSDSLGGNSKTMMISAISPHESNIEDTLGTLRYAQRAKAIVCNARVNEEKSAALMDAMREEIMALRVKLATGEGLAPGASAQKMMPEEIQREIAEKEAEMHKMEEAQHQMETLIEQQKRETEKVQQQLDVASTLVSAQKRERFAAAFRSAFLISQDKKKIIMSNKELDEARSAAQLHEAKAQALERELAAQFGENQILTARLTFADEQLVNERAAAAAQMARLEHLNQNLVTDKAALERKMDEMAWAVSRAERTKVETEERLRTMQVDLLSMTRKIDQIQAEKSAVVKQLQDELQEATDALKSTRQQKNRTKIHLAEAGTTNKANAQRLEELEKDREQLLLTVKAQQTLLTERSTLIGQLNDEVRRCELSERNATQRADANMNEVRILMEALREYEAAAVTWMKDLAERDRELAQFQLHADILNRHHDGITTSLKTNSSSTSVRGDSTTTPVAKRRSPSLSLTAVRSPRSPQPRVDRNPSHRASSPLVRWSM